MWSHCLNQSNYNRCELLSTEFLLVAPEPPSDPPIIWTQQEVLKDELGKCVSGKNVL